MPSSAHENGNQQSDEELRVARPNPSTAEHDRARLSATGGQLPGHSRQLKSKLPVTGFFLGHDSACLIDSMSPVLASSGSAALLKAESLDPCSITAARNVWERTPDRDMIIRSSSQRHQRTDASTTFPPHFYISHYHTSTHLFLNQPIRKFARLPSITREGRIVSLEESYKQYGMHDVGSSTPLVNDPEFSQALLQPLQSLAHIPSLLSQSSQVPSPERQPQELVTPHLPL
jgi:hypothetical protein